MAPTSRAMPAIIVGNALLQGSVAASDEWRQYGEERRRELLENDKEARSFDMNRTHGIKKYFLIGDRVLSQFRELYARRRNLEEIFVMGHRLIAFYTEALPKHKDYRSIDPSISTLREKSINDLDWIRKRLDVIALRIDEAQLNLHIQRQEENDDVVCEVDQDKEVNDEQETHWESFSGWVSDFGENKVEDSVESQQDDYGAPSSRRRLSLEPEHADDPGDILDLDSEDETDDVESNECDSLSDTESDERAVHFEFAPEESGYDSSFLRVIASEEVEYEEDSEAVDSWAQDDESLESIAEYAPRVATRTVNYSEAEMLGNLLHRVTQKSVRDETESSEAASEAATDSSPDDEVENIDPATSFCSVSRDTTATSLCSYPSFDEPPEDEDAGTTSSPQDVMNFDAHAKCQKPPLTRHSRKKSDSVSFSDEEIVPIFLPGLRI